MLRCLRCVKICVRNIIEILRPENFQPACGLVIYFLDYEWSPFFLNDSIASAGASQTRARVKITPHEKSETRRGGRKKWGLFSLHT